MSGITKELARHISDTAFSNLPPDVIGFSKLCILDELGVDIAGLQFPPSRIILDFVKSTNGSHMESSIFGSQHMTSSPNAAFANSAITGIAEYDDVHDAFKVHIGVVVVPAALSMAEREKSDGAHLLTAVALGYETAARVALTMGDSHGYRGFHTSGTIGAFSATVAAAKLQEQSERQITSALGIAGHQAAGLFEFLTEGAWTKYIGTGRAAESGIKSAILAQKGFIGPTQIFEGKYGFFRAYSDKWNIDRLTSRFGEKWWMLGTSIKPYACCLCNHPPIDAVIRIVKENNVDPDEIADIVIKITKWCSYILNKNGAPRNFVEAQFSLPYTVAVAIAEGRVPPSAFSDRELRNPRILKLARKVKVTNDNPDLERMYIKHQKLGNTCLPTEVEIVTRDGTHYQADVEHSKGDPQNPMSEKDVQTKFRDNTRDLLGTEKTEKIIDLVMRIEELDSVMEITELLHIP